MSPFARFLPLAVLFGLSLPAAAADRPVVVELFTSQGCSSCPPADALLGELARNANLLPLAFHVDYWNRLGWKDPYSSALATARQRTYQASLSLPNIYTPQMVVDGRYDAIGSDRRAVATAIGEAAKHSSAVAVDLTRDGDRLAVALGAGAAPYGVWLAGYDRRHTTRIGAGENGGRTLTEYNIVRSFKEIGRWDGKADALSLPIADLDGADAVAVLVQDGNGAVIGAAKLDLMNATN